MAERSSDDHKLIVELGLFLVAFGELTGQLIDTCIAIGFANSVKRESDDLWQKEFGALVGLLEHEITVARIANAPPNLIERLKVLNNHRNDLYHGHLWENVFEGRWMIRRIRRGGTGLVHIPINHVSINLWTVELQDLDAELFKFREQINSRLR